MAASSLHLFYVSQKITEQWFLIPPSLLGIWALGMCISLSCFHISLSCFHISCSRVCISYSQRRIRYTHFVRWMSQICSTAVEHIFDGRRTKPERPIYRANRAEINIYFDIL